MPLHKIGLLDRATFSNIEHQAIEFVTDTLQPWLTRLEQAFNRHLFTRIEREDYYIEHLIDGQLRGDIKTRYESYAIAFQNGWLSTNEIRKFENMNPVEDGDKYYVPLNMQTTDKPAQDRPENKDKRLKVFDYAKA